MANGSQSGMPASQGGQANYAQLMHALMTNPQAFTGGGFGQTLAANPQGLAAWQPTMPGQQAGPQQSFAWGQQYPSLQSPWPSAFAGSPIGQAVASIAPASSWQPTSPPQQAAPNPIPSLVAQQQAAQAAAAQQMPAPAPPPPDNSVSGSGSE